MHNRDTIQAVTMDIPTAIIRQILTTAVTTTTQMSE
jgi:hypothetical protein